MQARPLTDRARFGSAAGGVDAGLDRFITKMKSGSRLFVMVGMLLFAMAGGAAAAAAYFTDQECPDGSIPKVSWPYCALIGGVFGLVFGLRLWRVRGCNRSSIIFAFSLTATFAFYCAAYMATDCNSQTFRGWSDVFLITSWICVTVAVGVCFGWLSFARPKMKEMIALVETIRSRQGSEDVFVLNVSTERIRKIYEQQRDNPEVLDVTITRASPSSHVWLAEMLDVMLDVTIAVLYWVFVVILATAGPLRMLDVMLDAMSEGTDNGRCFIVAAASGAWFFTIAALAAFHAAYSCSGISRSRNIEREIRNLESAGGQQIVLFYQEFPGVSAAFCGERCVLFQPLAPCACASPRNHPHVCACAEESTTTTRMRLRLAEESTCFFSPSRGFHHHHAHAPRLAEEETEPFLVFHTVAPGQVVTATAAEERWGLDPGQQLQVRAWIAGAGRAEVFGFQEDSSRGCSDTPVDTPLDTPLGTFGLRAQGVDSLRPSDYFRG